MRIPILFFLVILVSSLNGQKICVEQILVPNNLTKSQHKIPVYIGKKSSKYTTDRSIVMTAKTSKWREVKIEDCEVTDENDCMIWKRVITEEVRMDTVVVTDTMKEKKFEWHVIAFDKNDGMHSEYRRVLCHEDFSRKTAEDLIEALEKVGYRVSTKEAIMYAIREFQFDQRLPVGAIDDETLDRLGLTELAAKLRK